MHSESSVSSLACECLFSVYPDEMRAPVLSPEEQLEANALRDLLKDVRRLSAVLDMPASHKGLIEVLEETASRLIVAESSPAISRICEWQDQDRPQPSRESDEIDLPSGSVDLVLCHQLLDATPDRAHRETIIRELARITGRFLVVSCSEYAVLQSWKSFARQWLGGRLPEPASPSEIIEMAAASGFKLRGRTAIGTRPEMGEFLLFEIADFRSPV